MGNRSSNIFGFNPEVKTDWETIGPQGSLMPYDGTPRTVFVSSSSAADAIGNTGAQSVEIHSLDGSLDEASEVIGLDGQSNVPTTLAALRYNGFAVAAAGSGNANAGTIYLHRDPAPTNGVPSEGTIYRQIEVGTNVSRQATLTIPNKHMGIVKRVLVSSHKGTSNCDVALWVRNHNGLWQPQVDLIVKGGYIPFEVDAEADPGADIEFRAKADSGTIDCMAWVVMRLEFSQAWNIS